MVKQRIIEKKFIVPFIMVTFLFVLWGVANSITNPLVASLGNILGISNYKAALVQSAYYGGYATMAFPAVLLIRKRGYWNGIILGLGLYGVGAILFFPATQIGSYLFILIALYVLSFGLAFLEASANPFIYSLGERKTAIRRLNLAQSFNPLGSILGMFVVSSFILPYLQSDRISDYNTLDVASKAVIQADDLVVVGSPYIVLGLFVIVIVAIIASIDVPHRPASNEEASFGEVLKGLLINKNYCFGVLSELFYVSAQVMVWTFIIHYCENLGYSRADSQLYSMVSIGLFIVGRFLSTFLMRWFDHRKMLVLCAAFCIACTFGTVSFQNQFGLYCLISISFFMSMMFPTIYGMSLEGLSHDEVIVGAAGLVEAIGGGALLPLLQGAIIDRDTIYGFPAINFSFILPLICFLVVLFYGIYSMKSSKRINA